MANLTIKDIARMAGVSTTAVSFVLNNRPGVSDATRQKVQEIIRETSFIPNVHTRRLNLGKSFTIHVVLKQYAYGLYNQFALETLSGVFKEGKSLGYSIIFTLVDEDIECGEGLIVLFERLKNLLAVDYTILLCRSNAEHCQSKHRC